MLGTVHILPHHVRGGPDTNDDIDDARTDTTRTGHTHNLDTVITRTRT